MIIKWGINVSLSVFLCGPLDNVMICGLKHDVVVGYNAHGESVKCSEMRYIRSSIINQSLAYHRYLIGIHIGR